MRSLLGGAKEKLVHDPGAEGPEGEGEAAMTMMVIVYAVALGLFIYGTTPNEPSTLGRASPPRHPTPNFARRDDRRGAASGCAHAASRAATPRRDAAPRRRAASHAASRAPPPETTRFGWPTNAKKNICAAKRAPASIFPRLALHTKV